MENPKNYDESEADARFSDMGLVNKAAVITMNPNDIKDIYDITKKPLGTGGFGVVRRCKHKELDQLRACKTVPKKKIEKIMPQFKKEIEIL